MVRRIFRFASLPRDDKWLLVQAAAGVLAIRVGLVVFPFQRLCDHVHRERAPNARLASMPGERLAWAVSAVARYVPGARCLTQALALQWLMSRSGSCGTLRVGVAKGESNGFESHAWVEYRGAVILGGGPALERFVPIMAVQGEVR